MTPLAQAISGALLQFVWQGFLVSLLVSVAMFPLRRSSPNIRYLVYCSALLVLAALPVVTAVTIYDPLAGSNAGPAAITLTIRAVWNGSVSPVATLMNRWLAASQPWVLRLWILGVAFLSLRLSWLGVRVSVLRRSGTAADDAILTIANSLARRMSTTRPIRVLVSAIPDGPSVVGWLRPVILLPAATILNLTADQLEGILAHEIAHLRRYDDVVNIAQSIVETLLFYHPAVWWISNRIRHERELCCDDLAARASTSALCYARALTVLEKLRVSSPGLALGATGSPLEYRIRRIIGEHMQDEAPSTVPGVLALSLVLACMMIYSSPAHGLAPVPRTPAEYPETAREDGIQGTVPVDVRIDDLGRVRDAKAVGGPKELRQAAVRSAAALHFAPEETPAAGTERVNVEFQLAAATPAQEAPAPVRTAEAPARPVLSWRDQGEAELGIAAMSEKDPAKKLELLKRWEQQYPATEFRTQRTLMTGQTLMAVLNAASGNMDPAALDAGRKAGRQLVDRFNEYFGDAPKGPAELQIHTVLAYIAETEKDYGTAEEEFRKILLVDPEQAGTSYQLGATILREMTMNNELTRYSEAIYDFARSLAITGPNALAPEEKAAAESALKESYGNYHGGTDGLDELMRQVGASALPPPGFHIVSSLESNESRQARIHAEWAAAHPDLALWESTKAALSERGDAYFAEIKDTAAPQMIPATVVSQPSANRLIVTVDKDNAGQTGAGDAVLKFDADHIGAVRPGTRIQFRGVFDAYSQDPYVVTFVIRDPKRDIVGINLGRPQRNIFARAFQGLIHVIRRLA